METVQNRSDVIRVRDLTLAAYLACRGISGRLSDDGQSVRGHPLAAWEFEPTDKVRSLIEKFESGEAAAEPKAFHAALTLTRRELYTFLDIGQRQ